MSTLSHVIAAVYDRPWFTTVEHLNTIAGIVKLHVEGARLSAEEVRSRIEAAASGNGPRPGGRSEGAIAVIPVYGTIMPRASLMSEYSGGATVAGIRQAFRSALGDDTVGTILFDFDSPGGSCDGIEELAAEIRDARGQKPIVAIADYLMASAAYYLGSQADELVASPSARVGWVGTVMVHQEISRMLEEEGVTTTIIRNPSGKFGANEYEPLSDQARTEMQAMVDEASSQFHAAVSKGRGIPVATVKRDFGQGGGMTASKAKAAGMVDRVESFETTIRRLASGKVGSRAGASATGGTTMWTAEYVDDAPSRPMEEAVLATLAAEAEGQNQGGLVQPADDPDAVAPGEAGAPPSAAIDHELELARARARSRR